MSGVPFHNDRLLELLADREVGSLATDDRAELDTLLGEHPEADDGSMEFAAVAAMLAALGTVEEMPAAVRSRVMGEIDQERVGRAPAGAAAGGRPELRLTGGESDRSRASWVVWGGWLAAAACLVIAAFAVLNRPASPTPPAELPAALAMEEFLESAPDVRTAEWSAWDNPEIPGVQGRVIWSEAAQKGYMTFEGLAVNNPAEEQYQLWIIDERGMEQRISGAIFNCSVQNGVEVVEIDPGIEVKNAAAFAVTIEPPDGVWVSDMSRRVVIASLQG